jgi:DNA-binding response OmpR family regulator
MLLSMILKQGGFRADIAYDATAAKRLLSQNQYAAMTVDLILPGQDGISLIKELRQQEATRSFPIIVVSANAQQGCEELTAGSFAVIDCLDKPIDQTRLVAAVRQAVQRQTNRNPHIIHVEDDPDIVQIVATILHDVAVVTPASSLQEAQQKLLEESFDLVILDLNLPDGFGLELLPRLTNREHQCIPVVVFSAQEVGLEVAHRVTAALVKSRTSNQDLVNTIKSLIQTSGVVMPDPASAPSSTL